MAPITIKDIARKLNLSPSTISRALRDHPNISADTKEKVLAFADKFKYQPNLIAQSLQNQKTNTIGVVVPEIKHDFFSSVISGIEDVAYEAGYTIMVCQNNESYDREVLNLKSLISHRVAGILISISQETKKTDHLKAAMHHGIPLVLFDRIAEDLDTSKVMVDDLEGAYNAVEYLIRAGYRRIAHLAGPRHISISLDRLKGYQQALKKNRIPVKNELIIHGGFQEQDGQKGVEKLLALNKPPEALFAVNDPVAVGALIFLKHKGLRIPEDMALIGFSNNQVSALIEPPLTTVDQPASEIGKTAATLLLEQIRSTTKSFQPQVKLLKTKLIVRKST
jgi:LacI family transcriptional regulator